jgi:alpha-L-arabinofuranosidase
MTSLRSLTFAVALLLPPALWVNTAWADTATITVDAAAAGPRVNPRMYGIFLEEIGHGVDGGLYAELVRNRAFEDGRAPEGYEQRGDRWVDGRGFNSGYEEFGYELDGLPFWSLVKTEGADGAMSLDKTGGISEASAYCLRLEATTVGEGRLGVANVGFFGIGAVEGKQYKLSLYAKCGEQAPASLKVRLEGRDGAPCTDEAVIELAGDGWQKYSATLTGSRNAGRARLVVAVSNTGVVSLDMVSLFPAETWRDGGLLRADIAQMIADLEPGFVRFPGGCVVEGGTVDSAYNWKNTVGPVVDRREQFGPWHYRRTHGVGVLEYLEFCEDLKAEPLWVGFAGQTCIFREREHVPMSDMGWVRDNFLDLVQYANGPIDSTWGKLRAGAGRDEPFNLKYVEIGNENEGREYEERYKFIHDAMKAEYPDLTYLADVSYRHRIPADTYQIADQHFYNSPSWFMSRFDMYDNRDRALPPLYLGEVAVTSQHGGPIRGNLFAALAEGVFLMGCERNADAVQMVSYAPLLAHVDGRSWGWHAMIYHDSTRVFGTASYYLWQLFGKHRPDVVMPTETTYQPSTSLTISGQIGLGTWDSVAEYKDIRVEHDGETLYASDFSQNADGWEAAQGRWEVVDGAYRQTRRGQGYAYFGDEAWSDYTLSLKARKSEGGEGFLIVFGRKGQDRYWWNLGGWGNAQHALEHNQTPVGQPARGTIENNRWYDIKIEVAGARIRCYLDGELVHETEAESLDKFVATAGRDEDTGDVVVKVINVSERPVTTTVKLQGLAKVGAQAEAIVLASEDFNDNNSFDAPQRVAPKRETISVSGPEFQHEFPPRSLTVLRIKTD